MSRIVTRTQQDRKNELERARYALLPPRIRTTEQAEKVRVAQRARYARDPIPMLEATKRWAANNRIHLDKYSANWRKNNPVKMGVYYVKSGFKRRLKKRGLTEQDYNDMWAKQDFGCGACGKKEVFTKRKWHIDHCHITGRVRGILCHHCNAAAGLAHDNPVQLRQIADYLEAH